jgi:hypothetical protein
MGAGVERKWAGMERKWAGMERKWAGMERKWAGMNGVGEVSLKLGSRMRQSVQPGYLDHQRILSRPRWCDIV